MHVCIIYTILYNNLIIRHSEHLIHRHGNRLTPPPVIPGIAGSSPLYSGFKEMKRLCPFVKIYCGLCTTLNATGKTHQRDVTLVY